MPSKRPIQPNDPDKEPKATETARKDQLKPGEHPLREPYGKTGKDPKGEGTANQTKTGS